MGAALEMPAAIAVAIHPLCRHCNRAPAKRPRGLCWCCFYKPGVRGLYPSTSKFARRGVPDFAGPAPPPAVPTDAPPGTEERVEALAARAAAGLALFHPGDAPPMPDPEPLTFARTKGDDPMEELSALLGNGAADSHAGPPTLADVLAAVRQLAAEVR